MTLLCDGMLLGLGPAVDPAPVPEFVEAAAARATSGATVTISKPTGTVEGDLMTAVIFGAVAGTSLSGWTVELIDTAQTFDIAVLSKKAGPSEPSSYTFTATVTGGRNGAILTHRGGTGAVDVVGPYALSSTASSIVAAQAGTLIGVFCTATGSATVTSPPAGMTLRSSYNPYYSVFAFDLTPSSAGATGSKTCTLSSASVYSLLLQIY